MNAEIISVGTELLLGQVVNLDTAIVAQELSALGIDLLYSAVVGDNVERLRHAVNTALSRSGLLIMTGGLGPHHRRLDQGDHRRLRREKIGAPPAQPGTHSELLQ